jgi:hypothetical protein
MSSYICLLWKQNGDFENDEMFQRLIDFRLSTVREVGHPRWPGSKAKLRFVNNFWQRLKTVSEPLEKLILSWEDRGKCLKVLVKI